MIKEKKPVEIERSSPIPYYYQLANILREKIIKGEFKPNEQILSERELCERFQISRPVVRQALSILSQDGLIIRMKGRPPKVRKTKLAESVNQRYRGFYHEITISYGRHVKTKVIEKVFVKPPNKIIKHFGKKAKKILKLTRLRFVDNEPVVLTVAYFPSKISELIKNIDFTDVSLYEILIKRFSIESATVDSQIEAVIAKDKVAKLLTISKGSPLFYLKNISYRGDGRILDYSESWHRGDCFCFRIHAKPNTNPEFEAHYLKK